MYEVNYEDERFAQVDTEHQKALEHIDQTYDGMVSEVSDAYQEQINAAEEWGKTQSELQQERTDLAIEQINQQKEQTQKDYAKEQSGAFVDWRKQSAKHGANAEQMAQNGLTGTGFSESSQVAMYNEYQNRVAVARESYLKAVQEYDNAIQEAMLQNSVAMAEIAFESLQTKLTLSLESLQYKNTLLLEQADKITEAQRYRDSQRQGVLDQINRENALAEEVRQYDLNYELQNQQLAEEIRRYNEQMAEEKRQYDEQMAEEKRQYDLNLQFENEQLAESKRQFDEEMKRLLANDEKANNLEEAQKQIDELKAMIAEMQKIDKEEEPGGIAEKDDTYPEPETLGATDGSDPVSDIKKYGKMNNGQPKGINGHGAVSRSGMTVDVPKAGSYTYRNVNGTMVPMQAREEVELWKAADGTLWYWNGSRYIQAAEDDEAAQNGADKGSGVSPIKGTSNKAGGSGNVNKANLAKFEDIALGLK